MFREMRRKDRMLSEEEAMQILKNGKFGVMSVIGEDGYPYGVPVHYILEGKQIYCLYKGVKTLALRRNL